MHPDYRPALNAYFEEACGRGGQTPHLLEQAFDWYTNLEQRGHMLSY